MAREFSRSQRVASQIQKELAVIFQMQIKDPRLGLVTINQVELSKDLSVAKVYFTVLGEESGQVDRNQTIIDRSIPFIRHELGKRLRIRVLPELRFLHDESVQRGMQIEQLIKESKKADNESQDLP